MIQIPKEALEYIQYEELCEGINTLQKIIDNQHLIISTIQSSAELVVLECKPLTPGSIEHYYHFVFDLLLPLSHLIRKSQGKLIFNFHYFGPLTEHLLDLFGDYVHILYDQQINHRKISLLGMSPVGLEKLDFNLDILRKYAFSRFNIPEVADPKKVIVIQRAEPHAYYRHHAKVKGGGSLRRSIVNHKQFQKVVSSLISKEFEVINVALENISFAEQIRLFRSASLVIGLHGAGLSNCIWMNPGSDVIEIGVSSLTFFQKISGILRHNYFVYNNFTTNHISLDLQHFSRWLCTRVRLAHYLPKIGKII